MHYVLIFVLITEMFGSVSVTAQFDTKEACEIANNNLRDMNNAITENHNAYIHSVCYPSK